MSSSQFLWSFTGAFVISVLCIWSIMRVAPRLGFVSRPRADRWHRKPTPLGGGIAIYLAFTLITLFYIVRGGLINWQPILLGGTLLFALGLADDIVKLRPHQKMFGQILVSALAAMWGVGFSGLPVYLSVPLTLFWIVGITNAFNLLDNMDGLASGIALITVCFLGLIAYLHNMIPLMWLSCGLAGAIGGFLLFNFNPAKIFMGDCGSGFLGYMLAVLCLEGIAKHATNLLATVALPVLVLGVPILDTSLVTFTRLSGHRPVSQGGKDHMSHRLVFLGLSERRAVLYLYGLSALSGLIALTMAQWGIVSFLVILILWLIFGGLVGIFLANLHITEKPTKAAKGIVLSRNVLYKSTMLQLLLDILLISSAYVISHLLRFEEALSGETLHRLARSLPLVILVKLAVFMVVGLYNNLWDYSSLPEALKIFKAVSLGSLLTVLVLSVFYPGFVYSRAVFVIDWLLLLLLVGALRFGFILLREVVRGNTSHGKRTLIYGAGEEGSLLFRFIHTNGNDITVVGFIDDDHNKHGKVIHGVRIVGDFSQLPKLVEQFEVEEVLLALPFGDGKYVQTVAEQCKALGVTCRTMFPTLHYLPSNSDEDLIGS